MDASHQGLCRHLFFFGSLCVPGAAAKNFFGAIERRDVVFSASMVLLLNVQPLLAPPLNRVREFDVEVIDSGTYRDSSDWQAAD
jgi:hypothetical protein